MFGEVRVSFTDICPHFSNDHGSTSGDLLLFLFLTVIGEALSVVTANVFCQCFLSMIGFSLFRS